MSHYSKIFNKVPVDIPNRSGFDMSHENLFTASVGTLVPAMVDECLPGDTVTLGVASQIQLPPMATDFYGKIEGKFEAFFVPYRILYGGWKELITHNPESSFPSGSSQTQMAKYLPYFTIPANRSGAGSLADYLGHKTSYGSNTVDIMNPLPFVAYHKIWSDWYRDSRLTKDCFEKPLGTSASVAYGKMSFYPYVTRYDNAPFAFNPQLADSINVYALRQRCWSKDYFTTCTTSPQAGNPQSVGFVVNTSDGRTVTVAANGTVSAASGSNAGSLAGSFSIAALRQANAIQQWLERNNIAGDRYGDRIKAQFGVYPSDAITDRSLYLGSKTVQVYNKSVYQTSPSDSSGQTATQNPFTSQGAKYASPIGVGDGSLIDKFTAKEHGFVFVMFSLVPQSLYSSGIRRYLKRNSATDFPWPLLSGIGDQAVSLDEIADYTQQDSIFGYQQRYAECKYMDDEVHGLLRDGESLDSFALQRSLNQSATLGSSFVEIPTTYLDQVGAVASSVSNYGCWVDSYFAYKKSSCLPAFSIPTLGDMKDTHTEIIDNGGIRL